MFEVCCKSRYIRYCSAKEHARGGGERKEGGKKRGKARNQAGRRTAPVPHGGVAMQVGRFMGFPFLCVVVVRLFKV